MEVGVDDLGYVLVLGPDEEGSLGDAGTVDEHIYLGLLIRVRKKNDT